MQGKEDGSNVTELQRRCSEYVIFQTIVKALGIVVDVDQDERGKLTMEVHGVPPCFRERVKLAIDDVIDRATNPARLKRTAPLVQGEG